MDRPASTLQYVDFTYKDKLRSLTEAEFIEARDIVLAMWSGCLQLWECLDEDTRNRKRSAVFNLLVMWYLADMYPTRLTAGMQSAGGMPIAGKKIRDVAIQYAQLKLPESYDALASNQFGIKAAMMIRYAPEMMGVYG